MNKRNHLEDDIQMAVAAHLRARGVPGLVWWHTANGGKRGIREAARFKKMGVRAGVSDLILVHDGNIFALELKSPKGRPTEAQLEFMADMDRAGAYTCNANGLDRALDVLEMWGLLRRAV